MQLRTPGHETTVSVAPSFTLDGLAALFAMARPDLTDLVAALSDPSRATFGLQLIVSRDIESVVRHYGQHALHLAAERPVPSARHREMVARAYRYEHEITHHEPDADTLRAHLAAGLGWLADDTYPEWPQESTHLGRSWGLDRWRSYQFSPGWHGGGDHGAVVVVTARGWDCDGLAEGELDRLAALLGELGAQVSSTWNGRTGAESGSVGLIGATSEALMANVYRDQRARDARDAERAAR